MHSQWDLGSLRTVPWQSTMTAIVHGDVTTTCLAKDVVSEANKEVPIPHILTNLKPPATDSTSDFHLLLGNANCTCLTLISSFLIIFLYAL